MDGKEFLRELDSKVHALLADYRRVYGHLNDTAPQHAATLKELFGALFALQRYIAGHGAALQTPPNNSEKLYQALYKSGLLLDAALDKAALLDLAMDTIVELSGAGRGFLALVDAQGRHTMISARNIDRENIPTPEREVSDLVIRRVLEAPKGQEGGPRIAERLLEHSSILREDAVGTVCVPVLYGTQIAGVLYLDGFSGAAPHTAFVLIKQFAVQLAHFLKSADEFSALKESNTRLLENLKGRYSFGNIICKSRAMTDILQQVAVLAHTDATVLLQGETGTGKDLIAGALHANSPRSAGPFVEVDCGALPPNLLESSLFGYARGAFTGAEHERMGLLETAAGGTLFLDEIGNLAPEAQAKLLRALQNRKIRRLGETAERAVDFRLLAAGSGSIRQAVEEGRFRSDLFYRISTVTLHLPPLRERPEDIFVLAAHFLAKYSALYNKNVRAMAPEFVRGLEAYHWPGNVRELEHCIERALIFCPGNTLTPDLLPDTLAPARRSTGSTEESLALEDCVNRFKKEHIERVLLLCEGKKVEAAKRLNINRSYLFQLIKQFDIRLEGEA